MILQHQGPGDSMFQTRSSSVHLSRLPPRSHLLNSKHHAHSIYNLAASFTADAWAKSLSTRRYGKTSASDTLKSPIARIRNLPRFSPDSDQSESSVRKSQAIREAYESYSRKDSLVSRPQTRLHLRATCTWFCGPRHAATKPLSLAP